MAMNGATASGYYSVAIQSGYGPCTAAGEQSFVIGVFVFNNRTSAISQESLEMVLLITKVPSASTQIATDLMPFL
jgi:hypothetical protein